jgi:hypothetical protein
VVGVAARWASVVEESRLERLDRMADSTRAKGRYLLGFSGGEGVLVELLDVPFWEEDGRLGFGDG